MKDSILEANDEHIVLKFDEFSICEKPTSYYAWAEKNTRTKFITNEQKRERINGFLAVDLLNTKYFFQAHKKAKSEQIAAFFADLAKHFQDKNKKKLSIFTHRNPTHKKKMQAIFAELTKYLLIRVEFHFIAAYSPKLNLVEYVIHWIRQEVLHHADARKSLHEFESIIENLCQKGEILNKELMIQYFMSY